MDAFVFSDDRRMLMLESEFVRILRTTKGSGNFAPLLRQAWDGGRLEHRSSPPWADGGEGHPHRTHGAHYGL